MDPEYQQRYAEFSAAVHANQRRDGDVGFEAFYTPPTLRPLGATDSYTVPKVPGAARQPSSGTYIDPACNWDPALRINHFDQVDIDIGVMFPSQSDNFAALRDVDFEKALDLAYHRFMNQFCKDGKGRLRWLSNSTVRDIPATIEQMTYWAEKDENYAGVFLPGCLLTGACSTCQSCIRSGSEPRTWICPSGATATRTTHRSLPDPRTWTMPRSAGRS